MPSKSVLKQKVKKPSVSMMVFIVERMTGEGIISSAQFSKKSGFTNLTLRRWNAHLGFPLSKGGVSLPDARKWAQKQLGI